MDSTKLEIFIDNNNFHELYCGGLKTPIQCINHLQTAKVKFLGVLIDPNLNFHLHIKSILAIISSSLSIYVQLEMFYQKKHLSLCTIL